MPRWLKRGLYASLFAVVACNSGGGCSSCSGITPLPQGFPPAKRIENAASARLTDSGLAFLSQNLGTLVSGIGVSGLQNGVFQQAVGPTTTSVPIIGNIDICKNAPNPNDPLECVVFADIGKSPLTLGVASPNMLTVTGSLLVKVPNITAELGCLFTKADLSIELGENTGSCNEGDVDYTPIPVNVKVPIITDTDPSHGSRTGLSRIGKISLDLNIDNSKLKICGKNLCGDIFGFIAGFVKGLLVSQLTGPLQNQINNALCLKGNPMISPPCPTGSMNSNPNDPSSTCQFSDGTCVTTALGTEGTVDVGHLLASFSPTTVGGLDFLLAVGGQDVNPNAVVSGGLYGDLNPINNGATLGLVGGAEPDPDPMSMCGPKATLTLPTGIPTPDELLANTVSNWPSSLPGPHVGIAISERYANYALGGVYNSGALCVQISTDQIPQLSLISTAAMSMKTLQWHEQPSPIGLVLRPSQPPTVTFGNGTSLDTDPNLLVDLKQVSIDFYVWSSDRYIRAFTYTADLAVPVNLDVGPMGLTPTLDKIGVSNSKVTNTTPLLKEKPADIQSLLDAVVGSVAGMLTGSLKPIDVSSLLKSLGVTFTIPPTVMGQGSPGVRKLSKGSDNFLGLFGTLGVTQMMSKVVTSETSVSIDAITAPVEGLKGSNMRADNRPMVRLTATSSIAGEPIEYAYRVDGSAWHPWTDSRDLVVDDPILRLQGKHVVTVKSRVSGIPASEDMTPAEVPIIIDADPPQVRIREENGTAIVEGWDLVSRDEDLLARYSLDGGAFSEWRPILDLGRIDTSGAKTITVEVQDESGKVGTIQQDLRGRVDNTGKTASSGCGCTVPGGTSSPPWGLAGFFAAVGIAWGRWRRRRAMEAAAAVSVIGVAGSFSGCTCGSSNDTTDQTTPSGIGGKAGTGGGGGKGGVGGQAGMPSGGKGGSGATGGSGGMSTCVNGADCELNPGLVGAYTSTAVAPDGTIWVAGYNEADYANKQLYGDLVVGKWDATKKAVAWETVDGTDPTEMVDPTQMDTKGWRGGKTKPGDDVGLWTSIQLDSKGNPMVAYYDATHGALKFAQFDGSAWKIHAVEGTKPNTQNGRYAKLVLLSGNPVVAYLTMEPGTDGMVVTGVRVARAKSPTPASSADWVVENVVSNPKSPCRIAFCAMGTKCNSATTKCEKPVTGCMPACASGSDCFADPMTGAPTCQKLFDASKLDSYPDATGEYISVAVTPKDEIGLVYYDRLRGNLWQATKSGANWTNTLLDGQTPGDPGMDTGDRGIGASLAIDKMGNWHVAYVDGINEAVLYMQIVGGTSPQPPELVDAGKPVPGGDPFTDGSHIVGDDSSITVDASGTVRIAYMDATSGKLRMATRTGANAYMLKEYSVSGKFAGFFSQQVTSGGTLLLGTWWREYKVGMGSMSDSIDGDVTFLTP